VIFRLGVRRPQLRRLWGEDPIARGRSKRKLLRSIMKSLQNLILSGLIAAAFLWHAPVQGSDSATASNATLLSTPNPDPTVVPSQNTDRPKLDSPLTYSTQPVNIPLSMTVAVLLGLSLSVFWRKFVIDPGAAKGEPPSMVLSKLIREVEESTGYTRSDARAKAKTWLVDNVTSLGENDILLAKSHFSYLLPSEWGARA